MPWRDFSHDHEALLRALERLFQEGAIERLAGAINADELSQFVDAARSGKEHKPRQETIAATTLSRWVKGGMPRLFKAQSHKKKLVYEFLERTEAFETGLYRSQTNLPAGLKKFAEANRENLGRLRFHDLKKLDGYYHLYRRSWTTPDRDDRVLISNIEIHTSLDTTYFIEAQDYKDDARNGLVVKEGEVGVIFGCGSHLVVVAVGHDAARIKMATIHSWHPSLDGDAPIFELKGSMMVASGSGETKSYRFIAYRKDDAEMDTKVVPKDSIDPGILKWLQLV